MDLRESMSVSGSGSYYIHKGFHDSGSGSSNLTHTGLHASHGSGYMPITNPNISGQSNARDNSLVSPFSAENASPNIGYGLNMGPPSSGGGGGGGSSGDPVKKKRGRPRKYGPGGTHMSLELSSPLSPPSGQITPNPKKTRGRPRGSGRKQQLAKVGEWMNSSAGMAFTPHIIHVAVGEDIALKVLSFAQNRQRALCILSGTGSVSSVSFLQHTPSSSTTATYEGRYQILCLSGSYLVDEKGGVSDRNRTGGLSVSLCSSDGHVIGGAVSGMLIASSPTQVVVSSFIYGGSKPTTMETKTVVSEKNKKKKTKKKSSGKKSVAASADNSSENETSDSSTAGGWDDSRLDLRNPPQMEIDLTSG
ncbi:AT-hook motif nuclear-localized protein 5-like [Impatiens glandulifera]|uniref:AT-hook motif nuclear-localized protein 5-like n=1 Tax=Impatiens glandulifera TaxID=253017 RepID=UPI001FB0BFD6|nr:AT-hook motif nuclear-localized protein 5-like [Impatiens glandulifera]